MYKNYLNGQLMARFYNILNILYPLFLVCAYCELSTNLLKVSCAKEKEWEKILEIFNEFQAHQVQASAILISSVLKSLRDAGIPFAVLMSFYKELRQKQLPISERAYSVLLSCESSRGTHVAVSKN